MFSREKHAGLPFPKQEIDEIWKEVLLYQFHDILPGSSIKRVYDESVARYITLYARVNELIGTAYGAVANGETVFNSLSFPRREYLFHNGAWQLAELPAMGSVNLQPLP
jgi:alpha-mannosidase